MPGSHLNFLCHINFGRFLLVGRVRWILRDYFLTLVCPVGSCVFTTLIHKLNVNAAVGLVLYVYHVHIRVVPAGHHHAGVRGYLQIELVENVLGLVHLAELLLQVLGHVQELARLPLVPDVPYLDAQVVTRVNVVVVGGRELRPRDRIYNVREEVLARGVFLNHVFGRALVELRIHPQVAQADVALGAREQENIRPPGVVFDVSDHLGQLLDVWWLQVHQVESEDVVFQRPEVDSEIIRREEVLSVWRHTHRVNIVVMAIFVLFSLDTFIPLINCLRLWEDKLSIPSDSAPGRLPMHFVFEFPKLNNPIVGRQHLKHT